MTGWLIFGLAAAALVGLMMIRLCLVIALDDQFVLQLKVLCFTFHIIPSAKKNQKMNLRDYEIKRVRRKQAIESKRQKKQALKASKKQPKKKKASSTEADEPKKKTDIIGILKLVLTIIKDIREAALGYVGIDLERLYIIVSSEDAAKTAILYGAVSQGANLLFEFLRNTTGFRMTGRPEDIAVIPDFSFGELTARLKLIIRIRIWQILSLAFKLLFSFIRYQMKHNTNTNQTAEEE